MYHISWFILVLWSWFCSHAERKVFYKCSNNSKYIYKQQNVEAKWMAPSCIQSTFKFWLTIDLLLISIRFVGSLREFSAKISRYNITNVNCSQLRGKIESAKHWIRLVSCRHEIFHDGQFLHKVIIVHGRAICHDFAWSFESWVLKKLYYRFRWANWVAGWIKSEQHVP